MGRISRLLPTTLAIATGLASVLALSTASRAAPLGGPGAAAAARPTALPASAAPALPAGATRLGAVAGTTTISLDVTLKVPDEAGLNAFLADLSDPKSPLFRHFLRPGQFGAMFGPSLAQAGAVRDALRAAGLSPGAVSADRLSIPVTATAAAVDRALGVELVRYRMPGGRVA